MNLSVLIYYKSPLPSHVPGLLASALEAIPSRCAASRQVFGWLFGPTPGASAALAPLGISFLTFAGISYALDIQHGKHPAETGLPGFAAYFLFFPKIIAGPITRYSDIRQDWWQRRVLPETSAGGIRRFITGLAKKILIADVLGEVVTRIFAAQPESLSAPLAWTGIAFYTIQVLYDFAGYSDMAIGVAEMVGLGLPENFSRPYEAASITEFWRHWHITLSAWFRDYVYYPLEWRFRRSQLRRVTKYTNVLCVFLLTGLWHGLAAHYAAWGLLHGCALAMEQTALYRRLQKRVPRSLQRAYLMSIVVVGWVLFRSPTLPHALKFLAAMVPFGPTPAPLPLSMMPPISKGAWAVFALGTTLSFTRLGRVRTVAPAGPRWALALGSVRDVGLMLLLLLALVFMSSGAVHPVLYGGF
jgi:alginate O-acetyltransferase complex protein AlgI